VICAHRSEQSTLYRSKANAFRSLAEAADYAKGLGTSTPELINKTFNRISSRSHPAA
jgi:hypothetical protein